MPSIQWNSLQPQLAESREWSHSGIAVTDAGDVVFAEPAGGGLILIRSKDGSVDRRPVPLLEIHGIAYHRGPQTEQLWLADPGFKARPGLGYDVEQRPGQAGRLDLATFDFTPLPQPNIPAYATRNWEPTSVAPIADGGDLPRRVIVADGYGASLVHIYLDGAPIIALDGRETGTVFACPHGVVIDTRSGRQEIVIADRGNRRLVVYTIDGTLIRVIESPLFTSPSSLALRGDDLLVTELDGALLAVDSNDIARSLILTRDSSTREGWPNAVSTDPVHGPGLVRPPLGNEALNSPHGIAVAADGRVYLTEWVIGGRQLELTITDEGE